MTSGAAILAGALADRDSWEAGANCPLARVLGVIGTRSAMLIVREAFYGTTRFDDFAARAGITEAVAAARLRELTEAGLLEKRPYREAGQRTRHEYLLTDRGRDLAPAVLGLFQWGSKYLFAQGRSGIALSHADCGESVQVMVRCEAGHEVPLGELEVRRTPRRGRGKG